MPVAPTASQACTAGSQVPSNRAEVEACRYPPRVNQASTPCSSHQRPIAVTDSSAASAMASDASSPKIDRIVGMLNQRELTKPPLRPLGPKPQRSLSRRMTRASGSWTLIHHAAHIPV